MGGVYLNRGHGHFAMPNGDLERYVSVMSHELCHAFLHHLELPLWLDEAITQGVEHSITGLLPYVLDREMIGRHQDYWDAPRIRAFWSGESFIFADEGQELSYHLARFILHGLHDGGPRREGCWTSSFSGRNTTTPGKARPSRCLGSRWGNAWSPCWARAIGSRRSRRRNPALRRPEEPAETYSLASPALRDYSARSDLATQGNSRLRIP